MTVTLRTIAIQLMQGKLPPMAEGELGNERLKVCAECEHFGKLARQCGLCGCFMDIKAKMLNAECPKGLW
jgi:Family of unknown function (DUF6171)